MSAMDDIRRGIAANLTLLNQGDPDVAFQIAPYWLESRLPPAIHIVGIEEIGYDLTFQTADRLTDEVTLLIEAVLPHSTDRSGQELLDPLLIGNTSLKAAVESDPRLTSRLLDDGTVQDGCNPACDDLTVIAYRGAGRETIGNGVEVFLAVFAVQVLT